MHVIFYLFLLIMLVVIWFVIIETTSSFQSGDLEGATEQSSSHSMSVLEYRKGLYCSGQLWGVNVIFGTHPPPAPETEHFREMGM